MKLEFESEIIGNGTTAATFIKFPFDPVKKFGRCRASVRATYNGELYDGIITKQGIYDETGKNLHLINIPKLMCDKLGKTLGDTLFVTVEERLGEREYFGK